MRLSLVFPSWCSTFGVLKNIAKKASSFPPLSLCYIGAIAEQAGWEVQIIDAEVEELDDKTIIERVSQFKPDLIGLSATTPFFHRITEVASLLKNNFSTPIAVGGAHPSLVREEAFLDIFDYLFIGESEGIFFDFLKSFEKGKRGDGICGVMRKEEGRIVYHGDIQRIDDLDTIPWPARHLIPYKKYSVGTLQGVKNYTSFFMSRGCPFDCVFCANSLYGKKVRRRSLEEVIKELKYLVNDLNIKHIYFLDDTLTLNREYIFSLCREIKKNNLDFTFEGSTRANIWDEEIVKEFKSCGLIRMSFGLETADPKIRKIIKKEISMESCIEANKLNARYGIETINSVMLGLPGEDAESIKRTVDFLCKAKDIQHATYSVAMPYPGTEMFEMAKKEQFGLKIVDTNFSNYQRYGSAVMEVNGLKPEDVIFLQRKGLIRIYLCWWRIWPMIKRHGIFAVLKPAISAVRIVCINFINKLFRKFSRKKK
ncbi:MAG: radical SAM protein [Candidatus Zapsychrus exili]|nr:radical SAM protein [Candidatus Zapsychrus exili]